MQHFHAEVYVEIAHFISVQTISQEKDFTMKHTMKAFAKKERSECCLPVLGKLLWL
jgi:hypothetical protein